MDECSKRKKKWTCDACGKVFGTRRGFQKHQHSIEQIRALNKDIAQIAKEGLLEDSRNGLQIARINATEEIALKETPLFDRSTQQSTFCATRYAKGTK
jgi:hypothetical protein